MGDEERFLGYERTSDSTFTSWVRGTCLLRLAGIGGTALRDFPGVLAQRRFFNQILQHRTIASAAGQFLAISQNHHKFAAITGLQFPYSADIHNCGTMNADELGWIQSFGYTSDASA